MLKVLANEKRGRLTVESFDRSRLKMFMLRFSNKSAKVLYCERPKVGPWMKEVRDNTWRKGGPPTLPGIHLCTFQPSQRGFFRVHTSV
jgi:hypothetical protein